MNRIIVVREKQGEIIRYRKITRASVTGTALFCLSVCLYACIYYRLSVCLICLSVPALFNILLEHRLIFNSYLVLRTAKTNKWIHITAIIYRIQQAMISNTTASNNEDATEDPRGHKRASRKNREIGCLNLQLSMIMID